MKIIYRGILLVITVLLGWGCIVSLSDNIYDRPKNVVFTNIDVTNNKIAEIKTTQTAMENSQSLVKLLDYRKNNQQYEGVLKFPKGTFKLAALKTGAFELSNNTHIQMNYQTKIRLYGNVLFAGVPTGTKAVDGLSNFQWQGGQLIGNGKQNGVEFLIIHGEKLMINNVSFIRPVAYNHHVFDLNGLHDITISNSKFVGYGAGRLNDVPESSRYHASIAEAVQLDTANYKSSYGSHQRWAMRRLQPKLAEYSSNIGSQLVNVINNQFIPYEYDGKVIAPAQNPIGTHSFDDVKSPTEKVVFAQNRVVDPIVPLDRAGVGDKSYDNNYPAPLHFTGMTNVSILNNTFVTSNDSLKQKSWISNYQNDDRFTVDNFIIEQNKFGGVAPSRSIILFKESTSQSHARGKGLVNNIKVNNNSFMPGIQNTVVKNASDGLPVSVLINTKNQNNESTVTYSNNGN